MRQRQGRVLLALVLLGPLLVGAAQASTFVDIPMADLVRSADAIVMGRVESIESVVTAEQRIYTDVTLELEQSLKGNLPSGSLRLRQAGGQVGERHVVIDGSPSFHSGERVLVYLTQNADGSFHTTHLAMGKFGIVQEAGTRREMAVRDFGAARLFTPQRRRLPSRDLRPLGELLAEIRRVVAGQGGDRQSPASLASPALQTGDAVTASQEMSGFALLMPERRWFEPDVGVPVGFRVDASGDVDLGSAASTTAAEAALGAWTGIPSASLELFHAGAATLSPLNSCDDQSQIIFNDPFGEIDPPVGCGGTLGLGGGCSTSAQTKLVNGVSFHRQTEGNVVLADGFASWCEFKTPCNFSEAITHEVGHAIGLAHSSEDAGESDVGLRGATMFFTAQFDGRCAGIQSYDVGATGFVYPLVKFCGDVNEDRILNIVDSVIFQRALVPLGPGIANTRKCSVVGDPFECTQQDVDRIREDLAGLALIDNVCAAFLGGTQPSPVSEDLTPCDSPLITDTWEFDVMPGQAVVMRADTADAATAADLRFSGNCGNVHVIQGDEEVACTFPPPAFACPQHAFTATVNATCTLDVEVFPSSPPTCAAPDTANYILSVEIDGTPTSLTFVRDDSVP